MKCICKKGVFKTVLVSSFALMTLTACAAQPEPIRMQSPIMLGANEKLMVPAQGILLVPAAAVMDRK